ncbi:MOSC domain-containing protein [Calothrix sp. PCC 6303]|uniref:MOSC domain-containing protein n=1 Tax=Calothrix sp. PCC 6303 TaxID=1170562 RepID=UPI0002A04DAF|nr:MOSC N-terminal beta barrel domain-containing protein [Calothrix sp. PCC 6303]AFZ03842.1 MOSC domain protein beta barrel domain protein [Calothrix sp. PCC 6303]
MPHVAGIYIYPIKSLDGIEVQNAQILSSGALNFDREFAMFDRWGKYINGKRNPKVHLLRLYSHQEARTVSLHFPDSDSPQVFHLDDQRKSLTEALSDFFQQQVTLKQNTLMGFPDDTRSPGATIVSTATLIEVASWFPGVSVEQMRRRMRANIEIGGVEAFWEDKLFTTAENTVDFYIGDVLFKGVNPCLRCSVPTKDPDTGESYPHFQKIFAQQREKTLPDWKDSSEFKGFYRLTVNTRLDPSKGGKNIAVGAEIHFLQQ